MACIPRGAPGFINDSRISNARFNYSPRWICYCESEEDVIDALLRARAENLQVRVRAGGHHHEGMCSGDDVLMVDVSRLNKIEIDGTNHTIRVGPGAKLKDIYTAALGKGYLFPGGACGDVHVGGLVQGGGWGLFSRELGLTCDSLIQFRMVTWFDNNGKDGFRVTPGSRSQDDLYWAVCGGGGGNFGVATEFRFMILPFRYVTQFSATWEDRSVMRDVLEGWLEAFPAYGDNRLTTFCRLIAPGTEVSEGDKPSLVLGNFIGDKSELEIVLTKLLPRQDKVCVTYPPILGVSEEAPAAMEVLLPTLYQAGPPGQGDKLGDTCSGAFFRHKVSSAYPVENDPLKLPPKAIQHILNHTNVAPLSDARRYISLHSLGGMVGAQSNDDLSCFAYRKKPFLIQYQAWWKSCELDDQCIDWVSSFRDEMHGENPEKGSYTEGAFINFPDRDLVRTPYQKELMQPYYGKNFERLMGIKLRFDPKGVFDFPMGIPRP